LPSFVYLVAIPGVVLGVEVHRHRGGDRYAAPVSIKIMADGIRGVSPEPSGRPVRGIEHLQVISKVQLPMAVAR